MRNYRDDQIENGVLLLGGQHYSEEEEEYTYEDYIAEECDRKWKEMKEESDE